MYTDDNDGYFPVPMTKIPGATNYNTFDGLLRGATADNKLTNKKSVKLFACPSDKQKRTSPTRLIRSYALNRGNGAGGWGVIPDNPSFAKYAYGIVNMDWSGTGNQWTAKISRLPAASHTIAITENQRATNYIGTDSAAIIDNATRFTEDYTLPHGNAVNFLFGDGHAASHRPAETMGKGASLSLAYPYGMWTRQKSDD
jgi:prepilin-type processing-associated H-X9-DG protein